MGWSGQLLRASDSAACSVGSMVRPQRVLSATPVPGTEPIDEVDSLAKTSMSMSAISTRGRMHFMVFTETFDAQVMCRFLARLTGHFDRKVQLIVDRHSAHRAKAVRTWLADHKDQIELHFLLRTHPS